MVRLTFQWNLVSLKRSNFNKTFLYNNNTVTLLVQLFIALVFYPDIMKHLLYTGWPRNNATTLIVNFKDIINKTELIFILLCEKFIFQQNDTMIIHFG